MVNACAPFAPALTILARAHRKRAKSVFAMRDAHANVRQTTYCIRKHGHTQMPRGVRHNAKQLLKVHGL